jgi:hypothetical protein
MASDPDVAPTPWQDPQYRAFMDILRPPSPPPGGGQGPAQPEAYQALMATERRVLDTVDRVVNDARWVDTRNAQFIHLPLSEIGARTMATGKAALADLVAARTPTDAAAALLAGDRKIYFGLVLVALALALFFISVSS